MTTREQNHSCTCHYNRDLMNSLCRQRHSDQRLHTLCPWVDHTPGHCCNSCYLRCLHHAAEEDTYDQWHVSVNFQSHFVSIASCFMSREVEHKWALFTTTLKEKTPFYKPARIMITA